MCLLEKVRHNFYEISKNNRLDFEGIWVCIQSQTFVLIFFNIGLAITEIPLSRANHSVKASTRNSNMG